MKRAVLTGLLVCMVFGASLLFGQDKEKSAEASKTPETQKAVTPLRVQVVFNEYDGDKKISSLPYTLLVNADDRTRDVHANGFARSHRNYPATLASNNSSTKTSARTWMAPRQKSRCRQVHPESPGGKIFGLCAGLRSEVSLYRRERDIQQPANHPAVSYPRESAGARRSDRTVDCRD